MKKPFSPMLCVLNFLFRRKESARLICVLSVVLALTFTFIGTSLGASIIQDQGSGGTQIFSHSPIGQTFTAVDAQISSIGLYIDDANASLAPDDFDVTLSLYEGVGIAGTFLGSRIFTGLFDNFEGYADVDFSSVSLTVGDTYTVIVANDTVRWFLKREEGDPYKCGSLISRGAVNPLLDARFRVIGASNPSLTTIIYCPVPGSTLTTSTVTFTGGHANAGEQHWAYVGVHTGGQGLLRRRAGCEPPIHRFRPPRYWDDLRALLHPAQSYEFLGESDPFLYDECGGQWRQHGADNHQ